MALLTDNFHSPLIRAYYLDQQRQALTFLNTIGAKALVLEDQKLHELSTYDGIHEEADLRYKMVHSERIRSIKRKIFEKEAIRVIKCGRNGKYRIIETLIEHNKKTETSIVWLSKYNYLKKFFVDKNTIVSILQKPPNQSIAQVLDISNLPSNITGTSYNWTSSAIRSSHRKFSSPVENRSRHGTSITSTSIPPSSSSASLIEDQQDPSPIATPSSQLPPQHPRTITHRLDQKTRAHSVIHPIHHEPDIVPIRLKNSARVLDLFFFNRIEMEAFLLVLQRYSLLNISVLSTLLSNGSDIAF